MRLSDPTRCSFPAPAPCPAPGCPSEHSATRHLRCTQPPSSPHHGRCRSRRTSAPHRWGLWSFSLELLLRSCRSSSSVATWQHLSRYGDTQEQHGSEALPPPHPRRGSLLSRKTQKKTSAEAGGPPPPPRPWGGGRNTRRKKKKNPA